MKKLRGENGQAGFWLLGITGTIVVLIAAVGLVAWLVSFKGTDPGEVCVVQSGGPFDDRDVKEVRQPGEGVKNIGAFNHQRCFPATQRHYTIQATGESDDPNVFRTSTKDSVLVGIEGQVLFQLNTDPETVEAFYKRIGVRTFDGDHPYDEDEGWQHFLDQQFRPQIHNALRDAIARYKCAELNAACALVKAGNTETTPQNIEEVQKQVSEILQRDINSSLGGNYFTGLTFQLVGVDLGETLQLEVDKANAAKARVEAERQNVRAAHQKAEAAQELAKAYKSNPISGLIEVMKSIPPESQPIIQLGGGGLGINLGRTP